MWPACTCIQPPERTYLQVCVEGEHLIEGKLTAFKISSTLELLGSLQLMGAVFGENPSTFATLSMHGSTTKGNKMRPD